MNAVDKSECDCTICSVTFSLSLEGGVKGLFGMLPVAFCPTCLTSCLNMADQLLHFDEDALFEEMDKMSKKEQKRFIVLMNEAYGEKHD